MKAQTQASGNEIPRNARSQASFIEQTRLRDKLSCVESLIQSTQRKIAEFEENRKWMLRQNAGKDAGKWDRGIANATAMLRDQREILSIYQEQRDQLNAEVAALDPTPKQIAERAKQQSRLMQIAGERLEKDREADSLVAQLRTLLAARGELTAAMTEIAEDLEFRIGESGLDARRFERLLDSLPEELAATSERWNAWFFGKQESVTRYIVRDERLILPETLAHHGVLHCGDEVFLTDEEARELLREDRRGPERELSVPPNLLTVEAHEALQNRAKEKGVTVADVLFWEDVERGWVVVPSSRFSIRLRSKTNISCDGKALKSGDVFETAMAHAIELVRAEAVERPF
jgi:hypothetical protein